MDAKSEIRVSDAGNVLEMQIKRPDGTIYPMNGCSVLQFIFQKPDGSTITKDAVLSTDGIDGKVRYTTVTDDFDVAGMWRYQVYFEKGSVKLHTDFSRLRIHPNLPV